jgi:hypothetical protein
MSFSGQPSEYITSIMKRKFLLITLFLFFAIISKAQLTGIYTIGGISPDFPTFTAAVTALAASGVSGAVIFNARPGTYPEKISIPAIFGTSSTNTIIFQSETGDSTSVILVDSASSASANNYTLQLTDADFITINKITIQRNGTGAYASVIAIGNNSVNNKFLNNHILGIPASSSSTNNSLVHAASGGTSIDSNNVFSGNFFDNGSYGMYYNGQSASVLEKGTSVTDNVFRNQYARFISMMYQQNPIISGNDCATNSLFATMHGIYLSNSLSGLVSQNKVLLSGNCGYGIYLSSVNGISNALFNLANNMVHIGGNGTAYGLSLIGCTYIAIYYNSVHITGSGATSRCFYVTGTATLGIDVLNNAFVNSGNGYSYLVTGTAAAGIHITDFNDVYSKGPTLGYWNSVVADLTALQAASGMEANSVSADPLFYSSGDLHVNGPAINNIGIPLAALNIDIDGQPRSATIPDIGADEFVPVTDNVGVVAMISPLTGGCGDSSTVIGITIKNFGLNVQSGIPLKAEITGDITQTITGTYLGPLASNTVDTFYFAQPLITASGGTINISAYSELSTDQYRSNDTIHASRNFNALPSPPVVISPQVVCDNNVSITATADSGNMLFWYDQPGGNLLYIGNPFTPVIGADTTFYVTQHQGSGSVGCLRITECGLGTDFLEIENLSGVDIDATGWVAVVSNSYTDINLKNILQWNLDLFNAGEIKYKSDATNDNYWGNNILWNPSGNGWAMIVDNAGNIIDFVAWGWTDAEIQSLFVIVNGFPITIDSEWIGDAATACPAPNSVSRFGIGDNNTSADFACEAETKGTHNINLVTSFSDCGTGVCGSAPVAIDVDLQSGITVTLPADTILVVPFSYLIDAGPGYTSYLWSTGETTQSITVTGGDTYWVTVTAANGCEATDSILVNYIVNNEELSNEGTIELYPNPASGFTILSGVSAGDGECKIILADLRGLEMLVTTINGSGKKTALDLSSLPEGLYLLKVISDQRVIGKMLHIMH